MYIYTHTVIIVKWWWFSLKYRLQINNSIATITHKIGYTVNYTKILRKISIKKYSVK